jgi:hypothetical protein
MPDRSWKRQERQIGGFGLGGLRAGLGVHLGGGQRSSGHAGRRSSMRYLEVAEPGSDTGTLIPEPIDTTAPEQDEGSGESD